MKVMMPSRTSLRRETREEAIRMLRAYLAGNLWSLPGAVDRARALDLDVGNLTPAQLLAVLERQQ